MASNQNHGYDIVMQLSLAALQDLLGTAFADNDIACTLVSAYTDTLPPLTPPGALGPCDPFTLTVSLSPPTDVPLPPGATNPVDITIRTGNATAGTFTRIVVGLVADHSPAALDVLALDLANELYHARVLLTVAGVTTPVAGDAAALIRSAVPPLALPPVPVTRGTTDCELVSAADVTVIDDPTGVTGDAVGVLLTMGGGTAGDPAAFTGGVVPPGSDGVLGVALDWLCRCLSERLTSELNLPAGSMQDCRLQQTVRIDEAQEVDLTELTLTLEPPRSLLVEAKVRKEGFCYEASGSVRVHISLAIENGNLVLNHDVESPEVDIDVPWYCWVAAVIIGIVVGVLTGWLLDIVVGIVLGIVVGGILVLLLWLLDQVITGIIAGVTDALSQSLGNAVPDVEIPLLGFDIALESIFIDDIAMGFAVLPISRFPLRSEGELYLPNGRACDLDSGTTGPPGLPGADLAWEGAGQARRLHTRCGARVAATGSTRIEEFSRYRLSNLPYQGPTTVAFDRLFWHYGAALGFFEVDRNIPTLAVFGVRTSEGRLAAVQAVRLDDDAVWLRYRTYEARVPSVRIEGEFGCGFLGFGPSIADIRFVPAASCEQTDPTGSGVPRLSPDVVGASPVRDVVGRRAIPPPTPPAVPPVRALRPTLVTRGAIEIPDLGSWVSPGTTVRRARGACFRAVAQHIKAPIRHEWTLDGHRLTEDAGTVEVDGGSLAYTGATGDALCVTITTTKTEVDFEVEVVGIDADQLAVRSSRCVLWEATCIVTRPPRVSWERFRGVYAEHWGTRLAPQEAATVRETG